jgi:redox-sensitive bicupin YhaK (pirin superfamily)
MLTVRKADERGGVNIGWLNSKHTFSFGEYHDPAFMGFGPLRVINEDVVAGGGGFPPHSHRDMEILTYVLDGALSHEDSLGSKGLIRPGEIQRMSAGTGIVHSEFNASKDRPVHFLQIWIMPSKKGIEPSYEQKLIEPKNVANHFARIAGPNPIDGEVRIVQDAEIFAAKLDPDVEIIRPLAPGRRAWLHVARGAVSVDNELLQQGDSVAITDQEKITVRSKKASEILLFDLA